MSKAKKRLWKAIEAYRSAGGMEEHWARRDHLDAEIDNLLAERDAAVEASRLQNEWVNKLLDEKAALAAQEPVAWRYRTKAAWNALWSNWYPCSQEQYSDYVKVAELDDWVYEAQSLYVAAGAALDASEPELFGWMVSGVPNVMRGSLAEAIQKNEAKRIGGTCVAFPVYAHPRNIVDASKMVKPISECSDGEIYSRLSARDRKPDWSAA